MLAIKRTASDIAVEGDLPDDISHHVLRCQRAIVDRATQAQAWQAASIAREVALQEKLAEQEREIRQLKAQLVQPKEPKDRVQQEARAIPQEPEFAPDPTLLQLSDLFDVFQMEPSEAEPELKSGHVPSDPSQQQAPTEPVAQMPQAPRSRRNRRPADLYRPPEEEPEWEKWPAAPLPAGTLPAVPLPEVPSDADFLEQVKSASQLPAQLRWEKFDAMKPHQDVLCVLKLASVDCSNFLALNQFAKARQFQVNMLVAGPFAIAALVQWRDGSSSITFCDSAVIQAHLLSNKLKVKASFLNKKKNQMVEKTAISYVMTDTLSQFVRTALRNERRDVALNTALGNERLLQEPRDAVLAALSRIPADQLHPDVLALFV